jgi:hypothetical protein
MLLSTALALTFSSIVARSTYIIPGARWHDSNGNAVNAHAGCVTIDKASGKFFLFGEYKTQTQPEGGGVSVYSSDDLAHWESHGLALGKLLRTTFAKVEEAHVLMLQNLSKVIHTFPLTALFNDPK